MKATGRTHSLHNFLIILSLAFSSCSQQTPTVTTPTEPTVTARPFQSSPTPANDPAALTGGSIASPKVLPIPKLYVLDVDRSNETPSDLLDFMFSYAPAAGGGSGCKSSPVPAWDPALNGASIPAIPQKLMWQASGFQDGMPVEAVLTLPDGTQLPLSARVYFGCVQMFLDIEPGAQLGDYSIAITQGDNTITDTFALELPQIPIETTYQDAWWFAGFQPGEVVKISVYYQITIEEINQPEFSALFPDIAKYAPYFATFTKDGHSHAFNAYIDEKTVEADEYGSLLVSVKSSKINLLSQYGRTRISLAAIGQDSGFAPSQDDYRFKGICNGSKPTRLKIGDTAKVTQQIPENVLPQFPALPDGSIVKLALGPICLSSAIFKRDLGWFWIVDTIDQSGIWVVENNQDGYFLEPVDSSASFATQPAPLVSGSGSAQECPGAEPQRVQIGDTVRICTQTDRVVMRQRPQLDVSAIFSLYPGTLATIIEGPACANDSSWWKVRINTGTKVFKGSDYVLDSNQDGWLREGSDEIDRYFICPVD